MIVQCASCQTRFKIGDDKVTERGVKVRCTKCATVFVVRKGEGGAQPPSSATGIPAPAAVVGPATVPPAVLSQAPAAAPAAPRAPSAAPAAGKSRPPPPPPGLLDDLFGQLDLGAGNGASASAPAPAALPNMAPSGPSPEAVFGGAALAPPPKPLSSAATTGLEDFFGNAVGPAQPKAPAAPQAPPGRSIVSALASVQPPRPSDPFEAALAGTLDLALGPLGSPSAPASPAFPSMDFEGPPPAQAAGGGFEDPLAGLDLDSPSSPQLAIPTPPLAPPADGMDLAGSEFDLGLGLGEPQAPVPPPPQLAPAPQVEPSSAPAPVVPESGLRSRPPPPAAAAPEEKSLFMIIFNGVAFAALVAVILLAFMIYRNGGKVDLHDLGGGLRVAFGLGGGVGGLDLPIRVTGSGYYATMSGSELLFVSGSVENAGAAPRRLEVDLEVDRDGRSVAHGRAWPGRLPTPEDLYAVGGAADPEKLEQRLHQEPVAALPPRQSERFVVVIPKPEGGAEGATFRVHARPEVATTADAPARAPAPRPTAMTAAGLPGH